MKISRIIGNCSLFLKTHAPEIMTGLGLISVGAGVVLSNMETKKITEEECKGYEVKNTEKVIRYAPSAAAIGLGTFSIIKSDVIHVNKLVTLGNAVSLLSKDNNDLKTFVKQDENMYQKYKEKSCVGPYTFLFDELCSTWSDNAYENRIYLLECQKEASDILYKQGWLSINQALQIIDLDYICPNYGDDIGWNLNNPYCNGYVDFGLDDISKDGVKDFLKGMEKSIFLEFNCDGPLFDRPFN